jgi:hypothetical protein
MDKEGLEVACETIRLGLSVKWPNLEFNVRLARVGKHKRISVVMGNKPSNEETLSCIYITIHPSMLTASKVSSTFDSIVSEVMRLTYILENRD